MPGSSNFGTAGAGHAAEGNGAGSSWANPATMSLVEGNQIGFGAIVADTDLQFEADDPTQDSGGDSGSTLLIPSFAYVHSLSDDVKLGFSVLAPFGSEIDYGSQWTGSNAVTSASVQTIQAQPTISFRVNDHLSLGGGININYTMAEQELSPSFTQNMPGPLPDPTVDADLALDADGIEYGWTAGALWEFNQQHRVGVVYRSEVETDLKGDADITANFNGTQLMDSSATTRLNWENPASVMVSGYHQLTDKTAVLWDIGRTFYSNFETTTINADLGGGLDIPIERNWQDANRYAIGGHYQLTQNVTLQAGFSYDESPVETEDRTADLPLDDIKRYTLGAVYQANEQTELAFGIEYADLGNAKIEQHEGLLSSPAGDYDNSAVAASMSVNYKF
ncbi:aromatic hydrocarbon degradation protein [Litoribrevibacter albus]|uniref:Aromatic hydrocarbon degradation protein n=2 Tax=Litoribrevibacter albus TaxID=1473156 RepID=A0AA37W7V6_9GAMM|nr:aromatic hydrocarbon degradation protein [Litoribrevibacter albus]